SEKTLRSRNPASGEILGEVKISTQEEIVSRVSSARAAQASWGALPVRRRLAYIESFRRTLMDCRDEMARLLTAETGKPLMESFGGEIFGPLETASWLKRHTARLLAPKPVRLNPVFFLSKKSYNVFEPVGVVAIISPWNYAFSIPVSSMLTALA